MKATDEEGKTLQEHRISRRRWLVGLGLCAVGGATAWIVWDDRFDLRVERITVTLRRLSAGLDGFTIAHLTDLHRGKYIPEAFIRRAADTVMTAQPDLIVMTGDYVTGRASLIVECARALAGLSAPFGSYAVLGNHDHWTDAEEIAQHLTESTEFQLLRNQSMLIFDRGAGLALVGLDDPVTGHHDFDRALAHVPADLPVVLLAHTPDIIYDAAQRNIDLVLAGHTHGGQIVLPGFGPLVVPARVPQRFARGLEREAETLIYTSRGVGMAILPVRVNCPPEVTIITLRAGEKTHHHV